MCHLIFKQSVNIDFQEQGNIPVSKFVENFVLILC